MKLNFRKRAEDIEVTESRPEPSRRRGTFKVKTVVRSEVEPGSDQAPPQSPKETDEVITNSTSEKPKARLTADVAHETYVKIKTFSADTRKPVVTIIEELINTYCVSR